MPSWSYFVVFHVKIRLSHLISVRVLTTHAMMYIVNVIFEKYRKIAKYKYCWCSCTSRRHCRRWTVNKSGTVLYRSQYVLKLNARESTKQMGNVRKLVLPPPHSVAVMGQKSLRGCELIYGIEEVLLLRNVLQEFDSFLNGMARLKNNKLEVRAFLLPFQIKLTTWN